MLPGNLIYALQKLQAASQQLVAEGRGTRADLICAQGASFKVLQGLMELRRVGQLRQAVQLP